MSSDLHCSALSAPFWPQMSATDDSGGPDYPPPASLASTLSDSVQMVSGRVACLLLAGIILLEVTTGKARCCQAYAVTYRHIYVHI